MRARVTGWVAVAVCIALIASSCSGDSKAGKSVGSGGATVRLSEDISVVVPAGAASDGTRLELVGDADGPAGAGDLTSAEQFVQINVSGGEIVAPVTVEFANVAPPAEENDPAAVAQFGLHQTADGSWEATQATYDSDRQVMAVTTPGFSLLGWVRVPANMVRDLASDVYKQLTAGLFEKAEQPACVGEDAARADGWTIDSSGGPHVKWCFGLEDADRVVNIVNANRYPRLFQVSGGATVDQPPGDLATWLSEQTSRLAGDNRAYSVNPAEVIAVHPDTSLAATTVVDATYDGLAAAIFQLQFGLSLAEAFLGKFGLSDPNKPPDLASTAHLTVECTSTLSIIATNLSVDNTGALMTSCVLPIVVEAFKGTATAVLASFVGVGASAVVWVLSTFDYAGDIGNDDYRIVVAAPKPSMPLPLEDYSTSLLQAWVPSLCEHPAGNLVNGDLPGIGPNDGGVGMAFRSEPAALVTGDLTGDGIAEAAAVVGCSRGGISWPPSIQIYGPGPVHLASIELATLDSNATGRPSIEHIAIGDGQLTIEFVTAWPGENTLWPTRYRTARLHLEGQTVMVDEVN